MRLFKLLWTAHKWVGILLSVFFLVVSVSGFLLLLKKRLDWIQPPAQKAAAGELKDFLTLQELFAVVLGQDHQDFQQFADIDRVDFRPGKRLHKVRSKHNYAEIQVDAVTGAVLSEDWRPSDLLEEIHDGSFLGAWLHDWIMPVVAAGLLFLVGSGLYLWLAPIFKMKKKTKKEQQQRQREIQSGA